MMFKKLDQEIKVSPDLSGPREQYTKIPNQLIDSLPEIGIYKFVIAMWIARNTYGWKREWSNIAGYRIISRDTGIDKNIVKKYMEEGVEYEMFERAEAKSSFKYRLISGKSDGGQMVKVSGEAYGQDIQKRMLKHTPAPGPKLKVYDQVYGQGIQDIQKRMFKHTPFPEPKVKVYGEAYGQDIQKRMFKHTIFPGPKEKKEKEREKETTTSSSISFSHVDKNKSGMRCEEQKRMEIIAHLPLSKDQIKSFVGLFDEDTLKIGVEWEKTAKYDDLGAALYSACMHRWAPKQTKEQKVDSDSQWIQKTFGHLDGQKLNGRMFHIGRGYVEISSVTSSQIFTYGEPDFRKKLFDIVEKEKRAAENRTWARNRLTEIAGRVVNGYGIDISKEYVTIYCEGAAERRCRILEYRRDDFRDVLEGIILKLLKC